MITRTSFNNRVLVGVYVAMREAALNSRMWSAGARANCKGTAYVRNARRTPWLRVDHNRGEPQAFQFYDRKQRNITALVLGCLRESQGLPS